MNSLLRHYLVAFALVLSTGLAAQLRAPQDIALQFLRDNHAQFNLKAADVADLKITNDYLTKHNGVQHVWIQQQYLGIPVFNGLIGLNITPDGRVLNAGHRFVSDLNTKVNTTLPALDATKALELAMNDLGFSGFELPRLKTKINARNFVFEGGAVSKSDIPVSACYAVLRDGSIRLAWTLVIEQANTSDVWSMRVDALSGQIRSKNNRTVYCKAGHPHLEGATCDEAPFQTEKATSAPDAFNAVESYRVFAWPTESPAHGVRTLQTNPANTTASPFGWHDTNGVPGPEFNYTRGNNVWAYDDIANDNTGTEAESVSGGPSLIFDFPFNPDAEPAANRQSAITNLFYINNMMHDFTYIYGFDEAAGNFQINNYNHGGVANDGVRAEGIDGGGTDNANFSTPADGGPGKMQMFKWSRTGGRIINVTAPVELAGEYSAQAAGTWGAPITATPVTGEVVVTNDGSSEPTLGCNAPQNNVTGKIAMVDRGTCTFAEKAVVAQDAGAIGCIICNFANSTVGMAGGTLGAQVTIPVVMMSKNDCDLLKQFAGSGLTLSMVQPTVTGPNFLDGDFDNGIIAHEYGHGVSNRLTGGNQQADCLGNPEQMGEGWSDWLALVTTAKPADIATQKRGMGTYVFRETNDGDGIRRYPYSTDMTINPITFGTVAENTETHALGEIWAATLWDLYWAMVEKYGYDANLLNTGSGNGRAIRLVMDGLKMQPCEPGFIDGRDAILLADEVNFNSADTCVIMTVFARRGMGIGASQGTSQSASDGLESFDPIPTCLKELKIKKITTTPTITPGEAASFEITVTNHKGEAATNVVVRDELPAGLTFATASNGGTFTNGYVTWNLGTVENLQVVKLTYSATTDGTDPGSALQFRDQLETENDWAPGFTEGDNTFFLQQNFVKAGSYAWQANNLATEADMTLEKLTPITITGNRPALRFWNRFDTEKGADAGFVEFLKEGDISWTRVPKEKTIRNGYTGAVQYGTFAIPFLDGFSGSSQGWVQSYIDMTQFAGQNVTVRFRFGSDDNTAGLNWIFDDLELVDLVNYEGQACVTSGQGDQACASAPEAGVILNPGAVGTNEIEANVFGMTVQPNPASDMVFVSVAEAINDRVTVSLIGADGRLALQQTARQFAVGSPMAIDVRNLPAGVYALRLTSGAGMSVQKIVIR